MHRAGLWLSLGLLPAMAPQGVHAMPRSLSLAIVSRHVETTPYLLATGAPPLRFREAAAPVDPTPRPTDASNQAPAVVDPTPAPAPAGTPVATTSVAPGSEATGVPEKSATKDNVSAPVKNPAPILPDDSRPTIRPEDFIPYFQIPGSARTPADVTLLVPAPKAAPTPGQLPPSSATYTQTPK